ncbi:hypothetical protein HMPREF1531_00590 [Propionibacterium sp. oral taxon 192 str. F0372]|uniref:hypothetical protein n=1 Tax=Propionibacterium sp. oral taxon 192 TaxID=671222 RepID=UPI00035379E2|nr:hypothetical protein [Propionibacterium sp. oral taxon 192]EPH05942.1 hypothetical protein HMPREF1531_00590 [Propionibacterium sp. oral taxon 192 str. F0372]
MAVNPFDVSATGPQRAATADHSGYRADTDDLLVDLELPEELINPGRHHKPNNKDAAGTGMMPPMVGGAGNGGAVPGPGSAAARAGASGLAPGTTRWLAESLVREAPESGR